MPDKMEGKGGIGFAIERLMMMAKRALLLLSLVSGLNVFAAANDARDPNCPFQGNRTLTIADDKDKVKAANDAADVVFKDRSGGEKASDTPPTTN